jgi:hypothetical protein
LNFYQADRIFAEMLTFSRGPEGIFDGSPETLQSLGQKIRSFQGH